MERVGSSISFDINLSKILTYCLLFMSEFPDDIEGMYLDAPHHPAISKNG